MKDANHHLDGEVILYLSKNNKIILLFVALFVLMLFSVMAFGEYRESESAVGYVKPDQGTLTVVSKGLYTISDVHVKSGEFVVKGAPLFSVLSSKSLDVMHSVESLEVNEYAQKKRRITNQLQRQKDIHRLKLEEFSLSERATKLELALYRKDLTLATELLETKKVIWEQGKRSYHDGQISVKEYFTLLEDYVAKQQAVDKLRHGIEHRENLLNQRLLERDMWQLQNNNTLDELHNRISDITRALAGSEVKQVQVIRAPGAGYVTKLAFAPGQNVPQGASMASIVPNTQRFYAEVYVANKAASFIRPGQQALLEYDSFPAIKHGLFKGTVVSVDADVTLAHELKNKPVSISAPSYRVLIGIDQSTVQVGEQEFDVKPGATLKANIVISDKTLFEWLFRPLLVLITE